MQSSRVSPEEQLTPNDYEKLSNYWTKVMSNTSAHGVFNTKLPVRLIAKEDVGESGAEPSAAAAAAPVVAAAASRPAATSNHKPMPKPVTSGKDPSSLTTDQLRAELTNLRGKYDELVSFSVNLTAERDILNNTLEQTKRELNKYVYKSAANDNRSNVDDPDIAVRGSSEKTGWNQLFYLTAFIFWMLGCWMAHRGQTHFLSHVPAVGGLFPMIAPVVPDAAKIPERTIEVTKAAETPDDEEEDNDETETEL